MTTQRLGTVLFVPGDEWLADKDAAWAQVRKEFLKRVGDGTIVTEPEETVRVDEQRRGVYLEVKARVEVSR